MNTSTPLSVFDDPQLLDWLERASAADLDDLPFGVIGFDAQGLVQRYNRFESNAALFAVSTVLGQHVFVELAPCLNNYLVATRFEDAAAAGEPLDAVMPYVLTFRMRPTRVRLRLLSSPQAAHRYILVDRRGGAQ